MELGLTLGGTNKSTDLALALGVKTGERHNHGEGLRSDGDRTVSIDPHRMNLDLLPLWPSHETANTGSSEGASSGAAARGFDVNRIPATATNDEIEAVSSPNSVEVDFCMYEGEGNRNLAEGAIGEQGERTTSSRASDEDETCHTRKKLRLSKEQAAFLEESFKEHNTLNPKQKQALAKQLSLRPRQVEVWFQNRRARTKLKQTEVDCEYLKRCCETLTEENRRLHKELQELRTLKSSTPYYMQRPATTLTMCPSCERTTTTTNSTTLSATVAATSSSVAASASNVVDLSSKASPFPLSRPKFFPFSSHKNQPQKSAAS